jgi:hypothetical protein
MGRIKKTLGRHATTTVHAAGFPPFAAQARSQAARRRYTTSIALPIHIDATSPQNGDEFDVITYGPGWML